eukprot:s37_g51.t1
MYQHVVEVCAGIGLMGEGCQSCGLSIQAVNDLREPHCQFQQRQGQPNIVLGDVGKPEVIAGLHAAHPGPSLITAGFSCQPWSRLGDGAKTNDERAECLTKVLQLAFWLRAHSVLLECVEGAGRDPEVQRVIQEFCALMGFHATQNDLHLDFLMPIKRSRWWCMMTGKETPPFELRPLPKLLVPPALGDLLPFCPGWDEYDMHQLCLDRYETNKFMEFGGLYSNIVDVSKAVRTALHGWSNQLSGCPCGCRAHPFSESRLREKGIFGALIPTEGTINTYQGSLPNTRHMHPWELALLHGARPNRVWKPSLRLAIAGLGQCAAPVQSCWVVAQWIAVRSSCEGRDILPETILWHHFTSVFAAAHAEHPTLIDHASVQGYIQKLHQALGQSALAHKGPDRPIGDKKRTDETSHRMGRENPKNEEPEAEKKADQTRGLEDLSKQPGTRTPEPEKKTQQPGPGPREPEKIHGTKQPGSGTQGSTSKRAAETPELHPPMNLQAKPLSAFVASGPAPSPHVISATNGESGKRLVDQDPDESGSKAAQPMFFQAKPDVTTDDSGPTHFSKKQKLEGPPCSLTNDPGALPIQASDGAFDHAHETQPRTPFHVSGGLNAFATKPDMSRSFPPSDPVEPTEDEGLTQAMLVCAQAAEQISEDTPGFDDTHPCEAIVEGSDVDPLPTIHVTPDESSHVVQVIHLHAQVPVFLRVYKSTTVGSITVAEDKLGALQQPIRDEELEPLLQKWMCSLAPADATPGTIVTALWVSHHWFPVVLRLHEGSIQIVTTPGGKDWLILASRALGTHFEVLTTDIEHVFPNDCGFQAVGWLINALFDAAFLTRDYKSTPVDETTSSAWRGLFEHHLHVQGLAQATVIPHHLHFGGAANHDVTSQLADLLASRGVPASEVESRTNAAITKIGRQPVLRALRSKEPWRELKQLANQLTPRLQLVLPSEMQAAIDLRAQQPKPFGDKSRKVKEPRQPKKSIQITADDVSIPDGIFCDHAKVGLRQIAFSTIGPEARGVVVLQAAAVVPYIRNGQPISKHALGVIVVDHLEPVLEGIGDVIRFPARCEKTGEAILLTARLIQLGAHQVSRSTPEAQTKVDEVGNRVIRTVTYRDELEGITWDKFIERPIRHVIDAVPCLKPHQQHSPIIDVWDRQFLSEKLTKCRPGEASLFMSCFRVEHVGEGIDLQSSGRAGHYIEPRSVDGRGPDQSFRVIWLKADKQEAMLACQSTVQGNSLVRSGKRFGIRVKLADAESVHKQHKPTTPFLDGDKLLTFHAGPFPHGTNRAALLKLFSQWQWPARPCQPKSRAPNGLGVHWEIQATMRPPFEVYQLQHADVLITEVIKKPTKAAQQSIDIQGSAKTLAALSASQEASGSNDPWIANDPWGNYQGPTKAAKSSDSTRPDQVDMIVAKVLSKLPTAAKPAQVPLDDGDTPMGQEDRVGDLEQRMTMLEMTMQDHHHKQDAQNREFDAKITGLQHQVDQQSTDLKSHLDQKMEQQLSQIERLLLSHEQTKKQRHE